ncbi:MAG: hypothetical protein ABI036_08465 [Fibrobacteria bacterium]
MRRFEFLVPILMGLLLLSAGLHGCTGTSTESENTVGLIAGRAVRADGTPAPGARITLRTREIVSKEKDLAWKVLDTAKADLQGRFDLELPDDKEVFLEIREADPVAPHPLIHFTRFDSSGIRPRRFGDLMMSPSGTLEGKLVPGPGAPTEFLWVGVVGTSALVRLPGKADSTGLPFRLDGLPGGEHELTVAVQAGVSSSPDPVEPPPRIAVTADSITDAGRVFFEDAKRVFVSP